MDRTPQSAAQLWQLVDARAAQPDIAAALAAILDLANSDWTLDRRIDIGSASVRHLLQQHRVTTMVPIDLVDADHRRWLRGNHRSVAAMHMQLRSSAAKLLSLLDDDSIDTRVLKGLATAELDYPDPRLRHTGDIDLALRPADLERTVQLLRRAEYLDHPTPFDPVLLYGWTLDAPNGVEIDLHTRLFRRSPLDNELFSNSGVRLTSLPGIALCAEHRLVHAAGHFIISPPGKRRMSGVVDIARLLRRDDLDLAKARRFAAALGVESLVGAGIRVEAQLSGRVSVLEALDRWRQPDWLERSTRLVSRRRLVLDHLGRYREVPRGQRLRYVPTWVLPPAHQRRLLWQSVGTASSRLVDSVRKNASES